MVPPVPIGILRAEMMKFVSEYPRLWPSVPDELLVRAALGDEVDAPAAWTCWKRMHDFNDYEDMQGEGLRVLPLVGRNFKALGLADPWLDQLGGLGRFAAVKQLHRRRQVTAAIAALADAGVPVLLLKGEALLAARYFPDSGARPMSDVDAMVRRCDLPLVQEILERLGWVSTPELHDVYKTRHADSWKGPAGTSLDLHNRMLCAPHQPIWAETLLEQAEPVPYGSAEVQVPGPADLLLHACCHGIQYDGSGNRPFAWVCDAAAILRHRAADLDWPRFVQMTRQYELTFPIREALGYLTGFQLPVPADVLDTLRQTPVAAWELRRFFRWAEPSSHLPPLRELVERVWDEYTAAAAFADTAPSTSGFVRFFLWRIPRSRAWQRREFLWACRRYARHLLLKPRYSLRAPKWRARLRDTRNAA